MRESPLRRNDMVQALSVPLCAVGSILTFAVSVALCAVLFRPPARVLVLFAILTAVPYVIFCLPIIARTVWISRTRRAENHLEEMLFKADSSAEFSSDLGASVSDPQSAGDADRTDDQMAPIVPDSTVAERELALRTALSRPVIGELCQSIARNLSSTTEPLSEELLRIRKTTADFLNGIRQYEDEVTKRTTLSLLEDETAAFKGDLESLSAIVAEIFTTLDGRISRLKTVSERVSEVALNIGEISERIRLLSFNASIEAAHAGNAGRGFRVIAGEIKALSAETEKYLGEIDRTFRETGSIFDSIGSGLAENRERMLSVVAKRSGGFAKLSGLLGGYFQGFEHLYSGVNEVIASLSRSMDSISPVVQLHEITSQEIGNLRMVADDYFAFAGKSLTVRIPDKGAERDEAEKIAGEIRKRLTTEHELRALGRGIAEATNGVTPDLGVDNRAIELFDEKEVRCE